MNNDVSQEPWVNLFSADQVTAAIVGQGIGSQTGNRQPITASLQDQFNYPLGCALTSNSGYISSATVLPAMSLHQALIGDATTGSFVVTLPTIGGKDRTIEISKADPSANTITLQCSDGDTFVGGDTSITMSVINDLLVIFSSANDTTNRWIIMASRVGGLPVASPAQTLALAAGLSAALNTVTVYNNTASVQPADTNIGVVALPNAPSQSNWTLTLPAVSAGIRQLQISRVSPVEGPPSTVTVACVGGDFIYSSGVASVALSEQGDYARLVSVPSIGGYWMLLGGRFNGVAY